MKLKTNCLFYHHDGLCLYTGKDFDCEHCEFYAISPTVVRQKIEGLKKDISKFRTQNPCFDAWIYSEIMTLIHKWFEDVVK